MAKITCTGKKQMLTSDSPLYVWVHVSARGHDHARGEKGDSHMVMWYSLVKQWDSVWSWFDTSEVFYLKYLHWHKVDSLNSWHWLLNLAPVFSYWLCNTCCPISGAPTTCLFTSYPFSFMDFILIIFFFLLPLVLFLKPTFRPDFVPL